jgi:hypothetical protein
MQSILFIGPPQMDQVYLIAPLNELSDAESLHVALNGLASKCMTKQMRVVELQPAVVYCSVHPMANLIRDCMV